MITNFHDFVNAVRECKTHDEIYNLFEDNCSDAVRTYVYDLAEPTSPEPFREAIRGIGERYSIPLAKTW